MPPEDSNMGVSIPSPGGYCPACGYPVDIGIRCPECGTEVTQANVCSLPPRRRRLRWMRRGVVALVVVGLAVGGWYVPWVRIAPTRVLLWFLGPEPGPVANELETRLTAGRLSGEQVAEMLRRGLSVQLAVEVRNPQPVGLAVPVWCNLQLQAGFTTPVSFAVGRWEVRADGEQVAAHETGMRGAMPLRNGRATMSCGREQLQLPVGAHTVESCADVEISFAAGPEASHVWHVCGAGEVEVTERELGEFVRAIPVEEAAGLLESVRGGARRDQDRQGRNLLAFSINGRANELRGVGIAKIWWRRSGADEYTECVYSGSSASSNWMSWSCVLAESDESTGPLTTVDVKLIPMSAAQAHSLGEPSHLAVEIEWLALPVADEAVTREQMAQPTRLHPAVAATASKEP